MEGPGTSVELPILPTHLHSGENGSHEVLCTEEWVEVLRGVNGSVRTQITEVDRKTLRSLTPDLQVMRQRQPAPAGTQVAQGTLAVVLLIVASYSNEK